MRPRYRSLKCAALDVYSVRLTALYARKARALGEGNMGGGLRKAIEEAESKKDSAEAVPVKLNSLYSKVEGKEVPRRPYR